MSFNNQQFFADFYQTIIGEITDDPYYRADHLSFLLNYCSHITTKKDDEIYSLLLKLADSDIYDHLEGGFFTPQKSNDNQQADLQKSLLNNASFIDLLSNASGYFFEGLFSVPAINSAQWVINNLQSPAGVFYQGMNSDDLSTNYYLIEPSEIKQQLDKDCSTAFISTYAIDELTSGPVYRIKRKRTYQQVADATGMHIKQVPLALEAARQLLSQSRINKAVPTINQSINIIDNGKIISALLNAARQFNRDDFASAAILALTDIRNRMHSSNTLNNSESLALISALLQRLQYQWNDQDFQWLLQLSTKVANNPDSIIQSIVDHLLVNTVTDFYNLSLLTSEALFFKTAESISTNLQTFLANTTEINTTALITLLKAPSDLNCIIIRGSKHESLFWLQQLSTGFKPSNFIFAIANDCTSSANDIFPAVSTTQAVACTISKEKKTYHSLDNLLTDFT